MTKAEFKQAVTIAQGNAEIKESINEFDGFGLKSFKAIPCTLNHVARLIRYQAIQLDGCFDLGELETIFINRKKFQIV